MPSTLGVPGSHPLPTVFPGHMHALYMNALGITGDAGAAATLVLALLIHDLRQTLLSGDVLVAAVPPKRPPSSTFGPG